jgi:hypothetical protein
MWRNGVACLGGLVILTASAGGGAGADKGRYSLFDPTPQRLMRDMTTDRPDTTESPFTVDAGHVQVESNVFGYARSRPDTEGDVTDTFDFAATNIRIGLTNDTEINVVWQPFGVTRTRQPGAAIQRESGVGGVDIRGKVNLWGNDTFDRVGSALALLPYLTLPTDAGNGISPAHAEGGIIVPLALALPHGFGLGLNGGATWTRSEVTDGYQTEFLASAALSHEWTQTLGAYYEVAAVLDTEDPRGDVVVVGTGVTYALTDNVQLDAGVNVGVTSAADRFNPFVGVSSRF